MPHAYREDVFVLGDREEAGDRGAGEVPAAPVQNALAFGLVQRGGCGVVIITVFIMVLMIVLSDVVFVNVIINMLISGFINVFITIITMFIIITIITMFITITILLRVAEIRNLTVRRVLLKVQQMRVVQIARVVQLLLDAAVQQ